MELCQETGCVGNQCFQQCKFTADGNVSDGRWYLQEPLYLKWKQWDCNSDCRYHCMLAREEERRKLGEQPVKYHGRWPFRRVYGIQVFVYHSIFETCCNMSEQYVCLINMFNMCFLSFYRNLFLFLSLHSILLYNFMVGYLSSFLFITNCL